MKSIIKKIFSVVLSLVIMVEMAFPAFAESIPVIDMGTFHNVYNAGGSRGGGTFTLSEWDYDITNFDGSEYIVLEKYNGTDREITIKGKVKKDGKEYQVLLAIDYDYDTHDYHSLFENNDYIEKVTFASVDGVAVGVSGCLGADNLFKGCTALREVDFNNSLVRSGNNRLRSINGMFEGCTSLQIADLSELDLSECEEAKEVFKGCSGVTEIYLDGADFRKTYTVSGMFEGCTALESADLTTASWGTLDKYTSRM
ncbi:MAG: leucine-rich repeat protein, partial [Lachnospiraceae bacterium]|nr:leucine-rich repeat protein [Lachnospiraceae bacterium]